MPSSEASLFWIAVIAVLAPLLAGFVPRRLVPEVVLLLVLGMVVGPNVLNWAVDGSEVDLLRELGLGMLFLLAGFEIDVEEITGRGGRRALVTWLFSLGAAFAAVLLLGHTGAITAEIAVAIALTSTALGTLLPILKDSGLQNTALGRTVMNHGAIGELGPVVAMAVLLGSRGDIESVVVLALFVVVAVAVGMVPLWVFREGSRVLAVVQRGSDTTAQTTVRLTMLLLITLTAVATAFGLDIILGAFAAGFILRRVMPEGDEQLETKLGGLAFGFLIPIFFVTSGMSIDIAAVLSAPGALVAFLVLLLLVRGVPVFVATRLDRVDNFSTREQMRVALYATTGLPLIVAVTGVAVEAGEMSSANASILVAAGAITVLALPMLATVLGGDEASAASRTHRPPREQES
ncbi:MAG: cation:proton antiporter [Rhodococcus sp. (in: high G+C Gram-positive bacteria)]|jgi:Kef-type K+ transport system membrane component KefB|uniref:cation:proton antiporter n=1 Tax=Rhodococcoides yunnanense TaxID=278209 RepID=UPI0022B1E7AF|nr:cation:proton antiporter [Rhodococcus yunnanensis]MCZ4274304.1 cation:proton antiporter [Rhodococcus yunnanensis]